MFTSHLFRSARSGLTHLLLTAAALVSTDDRCDAVLITSDFTRTTSATIEIDGVEVDHMFQQVTNGPSTSNAFFGSNTDPSEARASGRADQFAMTANAEFDNRVFTPSLINNFTSVRSTSLLEITGTSLNGGDVTVEFFLPPGFLELNTQGELSPGLPPLTASIDAQLTFFTPDVFGDTGRLLNFGATLSGDFFNQTITTFATSQTLGPFPGGGPPTSLDLSPLTHSNLTIVNSSSPQFIPLRTITWEYPAFSGTVNVGPIPTGQQFGLHYFMRAEVSGFGPLTNAAAAINDPLNITQFGAPTVDQAGATAVVPEPSSMALASVGLVILAGRRRLRRKSEA
ncbi:hypothetical protein Mal4_00520 [Maioricimonas rarisocia]|uniref:Ice-binding protein C-terminal domain-containing protein n=1 Tax=Maioricimonas rarisocia TaxID=2528026 RepID=A0A517YZV9_9PLAN|nr:PEP-CTERM sorting domain-containing protein [Maioricimonas rarisocia]QDU35770.1 hypothetical protein Mal4_00520 [Maioricimonas rarisocia]